MTERSEASRQKQPREDLDAICRTAAAAIASLVRRSDTTADHVARLLRAHGSSPGGGGEPLEPAGSRSEAVLERFEALLVRLIEAALRSAAEDDREYLRGIRAFHLQPQESYSIEELAALWAVPRSEVRDVFHDEIVRWAESHPGAPDALRIAWADALGASDAFGIVRAFDTERALGADFSRIRPESWRTVSILLHLPRFITDTISAQEPSGRALPASIEQFILDSYRIEHRHREARNRDPRPEREETHS